MTERQQLKFKIKLKRDWDVGNSSMNADGVNIDASNSSSVFAGSEAFQDHEDFDSGEVVVSNPAGSTGSPSVDVFTVQCNECFKWRVIPSKEKYEEIREHITERPFVCETAREWRAELSCDEPPDITQDDSKLWAIDKPNIAQAPRGWERLLRIRAEGRSKFADVYYVAPTGKRLRSIQEIKRFLEENPKYQEDGVNMSKFSFQIPRPLYDQASQSSNSSKS